ncbi:MetQ/NlpA family ABC transporter substrate-binding protein (plasmid) [Ralstonia sp. 25C]|uniref:MetQ/NlpA family ABC transporter substrate-binding protein n=1 Tax=Ralstonia sp. 25C TaxID=3447363 RepID=UPI003F74ADCC
MPDAQERPSDDLGIFCLWARTTGRFACGLLAVLLTLMMSSLSVGVHASETQLRLPSGVEGLTLTLGVPPGEANEATMVAAAEAKKQGLAVQVAEFNDPELWHLNMHAAFFTIDANFFQSEPELRFFNKGSGGQYIEEHAKPLVEPGKPQADKVRLVSVGYSYSIPMGVYSKKLKRGDAIPPSTTIAVPSGPVEHGPSALAVAGHGLDQAALGGGRYGNPLRCG